MKKLKKNKKNTFYKTISVLLALSSLIFLILLFYIDLLPVKYSFVILIATLIFNVLNSFLINIKNLKKKLKKVISMIMIVAIVIIFFVNFYMIKTIGVLFNNGDSKYKVENYSVLVLKESDYEQLKEIKNKKVGYFENSPGSEDANSQLSKKIHFNFKGYNASNMLANDLLNSKVEAIVVEDSIKKIMQEEIDGFKKSIKTIYTFSIKIKVEETLKEVDVTKEAFAIYISGIDTYGEISSVSRSDVNMVMVVNPQIRQILLISIPRDYYVQLHGTTGTKDKLTHAGIYGIDMSIQTLEDLLELEINYYLKVNFTSVIDIVDALGGLDVYSKYTFVSYSGFKFKEGMNSVNGEQALDFVRTRKAFSDGDRQRGKNQQALLNAIIEKVTDKSVITKYSSLLDAINGKYQTNMSTKKITSLIKSQLNDMKPWTVTSYSLTGNDSTNYTYTYNQLLYVMEPDEESLSEAIDLIDTVFSGEKLEKSYTNTSDSSNKVIKVPSNKTTNKKNETTKIEASKNEIKDIEKNEDNDTSSSNVEDKKEDIISPEEDLTEEDTEVTDNQSQESSTSEYDVNIEENNDIESIDPINELLPNE